MANFQTDGRRISKQTIDLLKPHTLVVELWGPMNTFVQPPQELEVAAIPTAAVRLERSPIPIANSVRKWKITGLQSGSVAILAKAGSQTWDSFELNVQPAAYRFLTPDERHFIASMAQAGKQKATEFGYPLSAMIACACGESGYGKGHIYHMTGCPFDLQKPANWEYPKCETHPHPTQNKPGAHAKPSPFCIARNLSDAARLWCEYIAYFPTKAAREQVLRLRHHPKAFVDSLYLLGFGNSDRKITQVFGEILDDCELRRFDS